MRTVCLVVALSMWATIARGQEAAPVDPGSQGWLSAPAFKTGIDVVALNVAVTAKGDRFVAGLTSDDFAVYEDGVRQDLCFFSAVPVPLDLALVLDTSDSMLEAMPTLRAAAAGFLSTLRPGDRAAVVEFKGAVHTLHPLDGDIAGARRAIEATQPRGGTALFDALYLTMAEMTRRAAETADVRRQAIVVLSDGKDTASLLGFDDVMEQARRSAISIYTITLGSQPPETSREVTGDWYSSHTDYQMKALARETGARWFFPMRIAELADVYDSIAKELAGAYALGYVPTNSKRDGSYRHIVVEVPGRPGLRTRTRTGYLAPREEPATKGRPS